MQLIPGLTGYYLHVNALAVSGTNLFAGTQGPGVFLSTNDGTNWIAVNNGLPSINVNTLAVSPNGTGGTNLFAGTSMGVFLSTNNGTSWTAVNTGLIEPMDKNIIALAVSGTNLFAATGLFVWRRPLSEMITLVDNPSKDLPTHFSLNQNYPNPFNPSTTISFTLPSRSFVTLKIFDLLGREVAIIVSEEMSAGNYTRKWNAANMSSGIYFYRLQAGSFTETKKLVLLK